MSRRTVDKVCPVCGKTYHPYWDDVKRGKCKVCSRECMNDPRYIHSKEKIEQRLLKHRKINEETGCWEYQGLRSKGYGKIHFTVNGEMKRMYAHRVSAWLWKGFDLDSPLLICHHCDNPACFNPDHLFIGTNKDNMQDAAKKGRLSAESREERRRLREAMPPKEPTKPDWRNKLDTDKVKEIRRLYNGGMTRRELAQLFGVAVETIRYVVLNKRWLEEPHA